MRYYSASGVMLLMTSLLHLIIMGDMRSRDIAN